MSNPIKVHVTANDMSVEEPDKAIINSIELVNALVVEPGDAWQSLAAAFGCMVSTDHVRVSEEGRIIIRDQEVANKVKQILAEPIGGAASNNVSLCLNYHCLDQQ
ncbi:hypothetical protein [Streptomyces sp. NRRL S-813]|uniref:hypothetical protein n=1 Tax=Streptomyces sp. NRRL S-813 TaxID=1463919 RepID=UPI0004C0C358|nr:hypothetical protein [Streptomyces sp. NRRL S-813]